ncbi:hypothetical protein HD597_000672 [Nonomuraea thailandensis]|uniref:Tc1-like transposase DDE domain-containing protein n=1 Tax=Nonomuraea thailandensis TaxID=1188745 RepID=A0A9X2G9R5_9ACTN|nr:hypothetical protein [Nonomuraea thailandensis]
MPERRTHDNLRHGITSLFAAFTIADGTVSGQLHRRHRAIEFEKFFASIDKAVPAGLDVHLVCDNYATHNTLLTDKLIRRGVHTSVKAIDDDIKAWIDTWNDDPRRSPGPRPPTKSSRPRPLPGQDRSTDSRKPTKYLISALNECPLTASPAR